MKHFLFFITLFFPAATYACSGEYGQTFWLYFAIVYTITGGIVFLLTRAIIKIIKPRLTIQRSIYALMSIFTLFVFYSLYIWMTTVLLCS